MKRSPLRGAVRSAWLWTMVAVCIVMGRAEAASGERITFKSGELSLVGYLYRPAGEGPWPVLIWNHGSERNPDSTRQYDAIADIFVPEGYVVFTPMRRGHGASEGEYIVERTQAELRRQGMAATGRLVVRLLESEQLDDQLAALRYVKQLPFVDTQRIAVAGCSYGGISTLLAAEREAGYKAGVSLSPAALSWSGNPALRSRLVDAVGRLQIPVLLLQPAKDASLEPSRVLGAEAARLGKPLIAKIYPAEGPERQQSHCFGGAAGMHVWAEDAKAFLAEKLAMP